jgi:hypothetical protein
MMVAKPQCAVCIAVGIDRWPVGRVRFADYEPDWTGPEELIGGPIHTGQLRGRPAAAAMAVLTAQAGGHPGPLA